MSLAYFACVGLEESDDAHLLPLGSTEPDRPHPPLSTDTLISQRIREVAAR